MKRLVNECSTTKHAKPVDYLYSTIVKNHWDLNIFVTITLAVIALYHILSN